MALQAYLRKKWQKEQWRNAVVSAGPRYTEEVDVKLPIRELFEGIGRTSHFFSEAKELKKSLHDKLDSVRVNKLYGYEVNTRIKTVCLHAKVIESEIRTISEDVDLKLDYSQIKRKINLTYTHFRAIQRFVYKLEEKEEEEYREKRRAEGEDDENARLSYRQDSKKLSALKTLQRDLRGLMGAIKDIHDFCESTKAKLANEPFILVLGEAGMGKTHLLCDALKKRFDEDNKTFFVLGEEITKLSTPIKSILKARSINSTEAKFLREINAYGERKRRRVLLIVDALNESDIEGWKKQIRSFKAKMEKYPWVGVVLSCRTPFENILLPRSFNVAKVHHGGFSEYEFEAMKAYFSHHRIPLPEVPILTSEFSSPLFLSSFCKTAVAVRGGRAKVSKSIKDIAIGQSGMTKILEDFYFAKQEQMFRQHHTDFPNIVTESWLWRKSGNDCLIKQLAKVMAENEKESLSHTEVINEIDVFLNNQYNQARCSEVLDLLVQSGVVIRDLAYDASSSSYVDVIKFPFQKFSDHLIARYFLSAHLKVHQPKKSLSPASPIGKIFKDDMSLHHRANIAEAIIVEFPERIKKNKRATDKDLHDYIPVSVRRSHIFREIFVQAMYWRHPNNFLNSNGDIKNSIIDFFNKDLLAYTYSEKELLNLLLTTAIKPSHPLNADLLSNWLSKMNLTNRDLFWTEYLRKTYDSEPVLKLIHWLEEHPSTNIPEQQVRSIIKTLSWFLTTTSHSLRRRTARCIYLVGKNNPKICFEVTLESLNLNDPYIHEMMLASSYGVCMNLRSKIRSETTLKELVGKFGAQIYDLYFKRRAKYSTTHIYTRDYARGIVELAVNEKAVELGTGQLRNIRPPYTFGGIRKWKRARERNKGEYRDGNAPLGMDFENYTLGRLVKDRRNYDSSHTEWKKVKEQIFWRIYQLGYSLERFGDVDKDIASSQSLSRSHTPGKVDRYGKKYSWIAYHELKGYRLDNDLVEEYFSGDSFRETEGIPDPSFPILSKHTHPSSTNLLTGARNMRSWLKSTPNPDIKPFLKTQFKKDKERWVLLEGTVGQLNENTAKRIGIHFNGVFISNSDKKDFKKHLKKVEYIDDHYHIPNLREVRYEYAGELGWHPDFSESEGLEVSKFEVAKKKVRVRNTYEQVLAIRIQIGDEEVEFGGNQNLPTHREVPVYKNFKIRRPARYFSSEDYTNIGGEEGMGLYVPSNSIIKLLGLHKDSDSYNFRDRDGKLATISVVEGGPYRTHKNLLYIREDLLTVLKHRYSKDFLICASGERQYWPKKFDSIHRADYQDIYQNRENYHRQIVDL